MRTWLDLEAADRDSFGYSKIRNKPDFRFRFQIRAPGQIDPLKREAESMHVLPECAKYCDLFAQTHMMGNHILSMESWFMSCYLMMLRLNKSLIPWHNYPQPPASQARSRPHATLTRVGKGQSLVVGHSLLLSGQPNVRAYRKRFSSVDETVNPRH